MANFRTMLKPLGKMSFNILFSLAFTSNLLCQNTPIGENDVNNISKLLEHAKSSLRSIETFKDGLNSFELVASQEEVIQAIQFSNARNNSPLITKLSLPNKIMTICKDLFNFYEKNAQALVEYKEQISDTIASIGLLWPVAPINELLKKQNLMTWANKIFHKERALPEKEEKAVPETPAKQETPDKINASESQLGQSKSLPNHDLIVYTLKQGVTRRKQSPSKCSQCSKSMHQPTREVSGTTKRTDTSVTRRNSTPLASKENLPWMKKQSQSGYLSESTEKPSSSRQQRVSTRKKPAVVERPAKTEVDPDALQSSRETAPVENPKQQQSTNPNNLSGSNTR